MSSTLLWISQFRVYAAPKVTLAWTRVNDTNVVGYKIYYGLESQNYTKSLDVKDVNHVTISLPTAGITYYFAATTYDGAGNESGYSQEATYVAAAQATLTTPTFSSGHFQFSVTGTTNAVYVVESSTNLVDWVPIMTNTAPFTMVDANKSEAAQNFYRAVSP